MHIAFVSPVAEIGGAERMLLSMIASLKQQSPELRISVICLARGPLIEELRRAGADARSLEMGLGLSGLGENSFFSLRALSLVSSLFACIKALGAELEKLQPDIIHSNGIKSHLLLSLVSPASPVVWHIHDFISQRKLTGSLLKLASRRSSRQIAISEAVARDLRKLLGWKASRANVLMNATDTQVFFPAANHRANNASLIKIGMISTYARWKGQDIFLEAIAKLVHSGGAKGVEFQIIGGPIYKTGGSQWTREELERICDRLGIRSLVSFLEFQSRPADSYRSLDIVVHASTRPEPFGLSIIEAMACEKPVIVARGGGVDEIYEAGQDALDFKPGDSQGLCDAMLALICDPDLRSRLGQNGRMKVLNAFDQRRLGRQLLSVYSGLGGSSQ